MRVTVLLFGPQAQAAGRRELTLELTGETTTCAQVRRALGEASPALAPTLDQSWLAVNLEYADEDQPVHEGDEVALIGMLSGG